MSIRQSLLVTALASVLAFAPAPASAQTLRYANQGDLKSLDPYTLRETTTIAHHGHVYEGLVTRDKDLKTVPALAESWEHRSRRVGVSTCAKTSNSTTAIPSLPTTSCSPPIVSVPRAPTSPA